MAAHVLNARERALTTKSALTKLRSESKVPGIFYIKGSDPITIEVDENEINRYVFTSETYILNLKIDGKKDELECIIKDVQFDPVTDKVVHFDLLGITRGQVMNVEIPIVFTGSAVGVKAGGKLQIEAHKLEIEVLPVNIPEHIEIDITNLNIGDSINVRDLSFDNFKILNNEDVLIVSVAALREEEEVEVEEGEAEAETADEEAQPEVIKKGKEKEDQE